MGKIGQQTVAISGFFNPIHRGHIDYIQDASKLGKLIVIINNDNQVKLKGSTPFMNEEERAIIVSSIKGVDEVMISIDKDNSVCNTLALLAPDIFANGGDRTEHNLPEKETCEELDIQIYFGCGGNKVQSSSKLLEKLK